MAQNIYNVGDSLTAQELLNLESALGGYVNKQNSFLGGLAGLIGVNYTPLSASRNFGSSLRKFSAANDEEIVNTIMSNSSGQVFETEKDFKKWYDSKNYPPKLWKKSVDQWYKTKGEYRSRMGEKRAAESAIRDEEASSRAKELHPYKIKKEERGLEAARREEAEWARNLIVKQLVAEDVRDIEMKVVSYNDRVRERAKKYIYGGIELTKENMALYHKLMKETNLDPSKITTKEAVKKDTGELVFATPEDIATGKFAPKDSSTQQRDVPASWVMAANILKYNPDTMLPTIYNETTKLQEKVPWKTPGMNKDTVPEILDYYLKDMNRMRNAQPEHRELLNYWSVLITQMNSLFAPSKEIISPFLQGMKDDDFKYVD